MAVLAYFSYGTKSCGTRYLQFWTQKLRLLTKFACGIAVLNGPQWSTNNWLTLYIASVM
jgi:hypothetical protein